MLNQEKFAKDAMEMFRSLPDEGNDLYTRRYVAVDPGALANVDLGKDHERQVQELHGRLHASTKIWFDAIVSENGVKPLSENGGAIRFAAFGSPEYGAALERTPFQSATDKYVALVNATSRGALTVDVPDGGSLSLRLLFVNVKASLPLHMRVSVGQGARLHILEWHASAMRDAGFFGITRDIALRKAAACSIDILHNENESTAIIENASGSAAEGSRLSVNYVYSGGSAARARNRLSADGYGSRVRATELAIASKRQKMDLNTSVVNAAGSTEATLNSHVVAMHESLCYLKGFAGITEGSRNSRSFVEEHGMLIGGSAKISSMPSMAISENMVKATHSSATGPIDEESMFYLMTKGIDERAARQLLITGFFSGPISRIEDPTAREVASSVIIGKIRNNGEAEEAPTVTSAGAVWEGERDGGHDALEKHYKYRSEV